jgi:predicted ArsR family transcriptional regulator
MEINSSPKMESDLSQLLGKVKGNIIEELSIRERSMDELSASLGIHKNAVKEHMESLEIKGYARPFFRSSGAGRPRKYYELTEKGLELLPKKYVTFANMLVEEIEKEIGREGVNLILGRIADRIVGQTLLQNNDDFQLSSREQKIARLNEFVATLNKLGYYARLEVTDDVVRIIRHNCIFYELAKVNNRIICGTLGSDIIRGSIKQNFRIKEKFTEGSNKCVVEVNLDDEPVRQ